jgi:hypothetical protein
MKKWSPTKIEETNWRKEKNVRVRNMSLSSKIDGHMPGVFGWKPLWMDILISTIPKANTYDFLINKQSPKKSMQLFYGKETHVW